MKRILLAATSTLAAFALPGCLQSETTIHLQKDGSGTLVEQTTFGEQMVAMMDQMAAIGGPDAKDPLAEMFSPEKGKARATTLGEGVTLEKSVPLNTGGNKGASVTYHFDDINKLKISPGESMQELAPGGSKAKTNKAKPVTFSYTGGTLVMTMPEPEKTEASPADGSNPDLENMGEQEKAMMKQMLGDMKMSFKVVIEPGIAETDASLRDGNTITLMSMEMAKVLEKPEAFKKLQSVPKNDPAAAMEALKGIDGVKMETKHEVTVKVK